MIAVIAVKSHENMLGRTSNPKKSPQISRNQIRVNVLPEKLLLRISFSGVLFSIPYFRR